MLQTYKLDNICNDKKEKANFADRSESAGAQKQILSLKLEYLKVLMVSIFIIYTL